MFSLTRFLSFFHYTYIFYLLLLFRYILTNIHNVDLRLIFIMEKLFQKLKVYFTYYSYRFLLKKIESGAVLKC